MALDTAGAIAKLRTLTVKFDNKVKSTTPWYPNVCTTVRSNGESENYGWLGTVPGVREWLGERIFKQLRGATYSILNKEWEASVIIPRTAIEDDTLGMYEPTFEQLAVRAMTHPDELLFQLIVAGETTACFDGQYFFDTDHSWGDSGSQSNDLTFDASDHTKVTDAEFKAAFNQALTTMLAYKDDQGKPLHAPTVSGNVDLICLVPLALWDAAKTATEAVMLNNDSNVQLAVPKVVPSPYLTDAAKFYLFMNDGVLRPFVFQARRPLKRQMKGLDDREFKDVKFMVDARYNVGYLAWWNAVLTTFN